ncbi:DUF5818 domain-containing protein [Allosphingosinicella humi]
MGSESPFIKFFGICSYIITSGGRWRAMPLGSHHAVVGILQEIGGCLVLRRDDGGRWRIDASRPLRKYIGKRVSVQGERSGFDWLVVRSIREVG